MTAVPAIATDPPLDRTGVRAMIIVRREQAPRFSGPGVDVTGLASPSRGARETSAWRLRLQPSAPAVLHAVDHEEVFVALAGRAYVNVGVDRNELRAGDALIVPAGEFFSLSVLGDEPFEAVAILPCGARASLPGGEPFTPPWAV